MKGEGCRFQIVGIGGWEVTGLGLGVRDEGVGIGD